MKALRTLIILFAAGFAVLTGCSNENNNSLTGPASINKVDVGTAGSNVSSVKLVAGQSIDAGTVDFEDIDTDGNGEKDALKVTYNTKDGWELNEIHLFVGSSLTQLPSTKSGNPQVGQFPYKSGLISGTTYSVIIPFTVLGFSCPSTEDYFVAAHASVKRAGQSETAWGDGQRLVAKGNWAMYFTIYLSCDVNPDPVETTTETAFAYSGLYGQCFSNFPEYLDNPNRWGWTNGPLSAGNYIMDVYAGAGQCDISKGTKVGSLSVNYSGTAAAITITLSGTNPVTGAEYGLEEFQLYAGTELFPRNKQGELTIAPGQYPLKATELNNVKTYTFTVKNLTGPVYVIAHAVVSGFPKSI